MTDAPTRPTRPHLDCDHNYMDGWLNCDHASHLPTDRCLGMDAEGQLWPIADNSVVEQMPAHVLALQGLARL